MKLFYTLLAVKNSQIVELSQQQKYCFLSELKKPAHFQKWDCSEPIIQE